MPIENLWVKKTLELVKNTAYLDKLSEIYFPLREVKRTIDEKEKMQIIEYFKKKKIKELITYFFELEKKKKLKFPIKDPYVAFLKRSYYANKDEFELFYHKNPITIKRLEKKIISLGIDEIIRRITEPIEFNRRIGPMFKNWLKKNFNFIKIEDLKFKKINGVYFLEGSDNKLKHFANKYLNFKLEKGPDFIAKVGEHFVIGETKFLTDFGGHQDRQLEDALKLLRSPGNAIKVILLDGVVWLNTRNKMCLIVRNLRKDENAFSALLLKDFLNYIIGN